MIKSLDKKLQEIHANPSSKAFIIADAKDADMAFGVRATGTRNYLAKSGEIPAQFSPEVWTREEFGYRSLDVRQCQRAAEHQGRALPELSHDAGCPR